MTDEKGPKKPSYQDRVEQAKLVRKIVLISVLAISTILIAAILYIYFYINSSLAPMNSNSDEVVEVHIPIGSSSTQIGRILESEGLIKNATVFRYYVRYKNETGFQAGDYQLTKSMSVKDIISALKEGKILLDPVLVFTVPEGLWLESIVDIIAENTAHEVDEIYEIMSNKDFLNDLIERYEVVTEDILQTGIRYPLEGYLYPARYDFYDENISIQLIVEEMVKRTDHEFMKLYAEHPNEDYTVHELITLASIVEREAQKSEDRYKISGVLFNRLDQGMMLQVDPTVAYAQGEHIYMTSTSQLDIDSPYNTYRYAGVPIGPIASPGLDSMKATLVPEEIDALFFYARYTGEVIYSKTFEEHNRVHQKYQHEWRQAAQ